MISNWNRRDFLRATAGIAAAGGPATLFPHLAAASDRIGAPLRITKVEPIILRHPPAPDQSEDELVSAMPIGEMTGGPGLWNRLQRAGSVSGGRAQTVLVKITTDQGVAGWGEAHAVVTPRVVKTIITDMLSPVLVGEDARRIVPLWEKMYTTQRLRGYGTGYFTRALAGADIALWDVVGKATGLPVYQLLGGKFRDKIPTYQGAGGAKTPEQVRKDVQALLDRGFATQKINLAKGRGEHVRDINRVVAASEVLQGKGQILVDSLGGYTLAEATIVGRELEALGNVGWWEDVLLPEDYDGYARLADTIDIPICVGEQYSNRFQFKEFFERRACDIINPDTSRIGITETHRIGVMADAHNVLFSPHSSHGAAPYRASAIHLCAALPNAVILEGGDNYRKPFGNPLLKKPLPYAPGYVRVPDDPGLGVEFDEEELAKLTVEI